MPSQWQIHSCGHCSSLVSKYIVPLLTSINCVRNLSWITLFIQINITPLSFVNKLPISCLTLTVQYNLNSWSYFLISSKSSFSCWPELSPPAPSSDLSFTFHHPSDRSKRPLWSLPSNPKVEEKNIKPFVIRLLSCALISFACSLPFYTLQFAILGKQHAVLASPPWNVLFFASEMIFPFIFQGNCCSAAKPQFSAQFCWINWPHTSSLRVGNQELVIQLSVLLPLWH